jgi:hypothetical protein
MNRRTIIDAWGQDELICPKCNKPMLKSLSQSGCKNHHLQISFIVPAWWCKPCDISIKTEHNIKYLKQELRIAIDKYSGS